jgi:hypothetical protein
MVLAVPIMRGMASYSDLKTLKLYDFIRMNEMLLVQGENESRLNEAAGKKAKGNQA